MSITLTTGVLLQLNGATIENDVSGFVSAFHVDFLTNSVLITLLQGNVVGNVASQGQYGATVNVTVNLSTGAWTSSNGKAGTVTGASFTTFVSQMKADRNLMETFAAGASGIMPGTQVAWS
ncbi:MAG TPA: hypothetical protein VGS27_21305 [Candidatus Sulfotelmatobacter sp.]|nr:hypothetical protein [Candidatus Sulfotelmatobacter sp.]